MAKKNPRQTSPKVAKIASKLLRDPKTPKSVKEVAGSDLAQARPVKKGRNNLLFSNHYLIIK